MSTFKSICAIGKLNIDLNLTLRKSEADYYEFKISDYNTIQDLKKLFYPNETNIENSKENKIENEFEKPKINYLDYISLTSDDKFINMLLFINRAFKEKVFVELVLLNKLEFSEEKEFIKFIISQVCSKNYFFIIENKIYNISSKLNFKIQILEDDTDNIIESKIFQLFENNEMPDENKENEKNLYYKFHYNFNKCNYFISNFEDMMNIENESPYDIALFYKLLILNNSKLKIITNISKNCINESSETELINSLKKIIDLSDFIISDKFTLNNFYEIYFSIFKNEKEANKIKKNIKPGSDYIIYDNDKKRKNIERITLIIDNFENIKIYKQEGVKMQITYDEDYICNEILKGNKERKMKIINENINYFICIFVGGFLSRYFHDKTFKTCINAGILCVNNMIEITKNNIDYITDLDFYNVVVSTRKKKNNKRERNKLLFEIKKNKIKENGFYLDCTNLNSNKNEEYNALYDENCQTFLTNPLTKIHLQKQGFINRKGVILKDPDKIVLINHISTKRFLRTTNLNFRFKPSSLKKTRNQLSQGNFDYDYLKNNNQHKRYKSEEREIEKLKEGLKDNKNNKKKGKSKLPPMLIRSYLLNNIQFENDYKKYLKTRNTFFSPPNIENKNKEYMKKKDFMKILKRFEIKSKNSNNNSQK